MFGFGKKKEMLQQERTYDSKESLESSLNGEVVEDLQVLARAVDKFDKLAEQAKTPEQKKGVESLKDRAIKSIKEFFKFSYECTAVGLLVLSVDYYLTRNAVERKQDKNGNIEYLHSDKETTHILNTLSGRERFSFYESLKHFRNVVRAWIENQNVKLPDGFDGYTLEEMDIYWKSVYGQFKDARLPQDLIDIFYYSYALSINISQDQSQEIYNLIWKVEEECGNPNIRFQTVGFSIGGVIVDDLNSRPYFDAATNTVYLPIDSFAWSSALGYKNLIAELSHGKQLNDNPLRFYAKVLSSIVRILHKGGLNIKNISDAQLEEYDLPGSFENEAHSTIEPHLEEKYKDLLRGK